MKTWVRAAILVAVVAASVISIGKLVADSDPRVEVTPYVVDLGTVKVGEVISKTVRLRNRGGGTLVIRDVVRSCACTAAIVGKAELRPSDDTPLQITVHPGELGEGRVETRVTLLSNDPRNPGLVVPIIGTVIPEFTLSDRAIDFGVVDKAEAPTKHVTVSAVGSHEVRPLTARSTVSGVAVQSRQNGYALEVDVAMDPLQLIGQRVFGNVVISTTSRFVPELRIPIRGAVRSFDGSADSQRAVSSR